MVFAYRLQLTTRKTKSFPSLGKDNHPPKHFWEGDMRIPQNVSFRNWNGWLFADALRIANHQLWAYLVAGSNNFYLFSRTSIQAQGRSIQLSSNSLVISIPQLRTVNLWVSNFFRALSHQKCLGIIKVHSFMSPKSYKITIKTGRSRDATIYMDSHSDSLEILCALGLFSPPSYRSPCHLPSLMGRQ